MAIISLDTARQHCKADTRDDSLLSLYIIAAQRRAEMMLNRRIFETAEELEAAIAAVPALSDAALTALFDAETAAKTAYDAAIAAAEALTDLDARARAIAQAEFNYDVAMRNARAIFTAGAGDRDNSVYGIVATDDIRAAMLLTIGHLFRNREDVVTGQSAQVAELPNAASALLWPYTRIRGF